VRARQHVEKEDSFEELGPRVPSPRTRLASVVGCVGCVRRSARILAPDVRVRAVVRIGLGNDPIAEGGGGSEDPVVGGEVHAGSRDQCGEAFDQGDGVEDQVRRSVLPASLELAEHFLAVGAQ
jgi:hypothetical protein